MIFRFLGSEIDVCASAGDGLDAAEDGFVVVRPPRSPQPHQTISTTDSSAAAAHALLPPSCRVENDHVMLEISEPASAEGGEGHTVRFPVRMHDYLQTLAHYMRHYGNGFLPSFLVQPTGSS